MDFLYTVHSQLFRARRQFAGPSGWILRWQGSQWELYNPR
jgi:hypothetical protein